MPDEPKLDADGNPIAVAAAPAFDAVAMGKIVADAARDAVKANLDANPPPVVRTAEPLAESADALEQVLAPYINKRANAGILIAQLAADKADFYSEADPEVLSERLHFKDEVEKRALGLAQAGRALPRMDIFNHLKGEQETKVSDFRGARKKAREDRVRLEGGDHGGGAPSRDGAPRLVTAEHAYDLQSTGKLDEALSDKAF